MERFIGCIELEDDKGCRLGALQLSSSEEFEIELSEGLVDVTCDDDEFGVMRLMIIPNEEDD